jgi:hypothetical protein
MLYLCIFGSLLNLNALKWHKIHGHSIRMPKAFGDGDELLIMAEL